MIVCWLNNIANSDAADMLLAADYIEKRRFSRITFVMKGTEVQGNSAGHVSCLQIPANL